MSDQVHWMIEIDIKEGELENVKRLSADLAENTQKNEPDTLIYEWVISEDETKCHLFERYANSSAALAHLATFGANYAERFMASCNPTRFVVYGKPSDELRKVLADFGPTYMQDLSGFTR